MFSITHTPPILSRNSIARKLILKDNQSVGSEAVGLFALFPFQLMLALAIVSGAFTPEAAHQIYTPLALQIFVLVNAAIHFCYTIGIIFTATLTVTAFDRNVWARDIDSSPSPFPVPVVLGFYFPCCYSLPQTECHDTNDSQVMSTVPCLPGCNCATKLRLPDCAQATVADAPVPKRGLLSGLSGWKSSGSLSRSLVRVPNAAERRSSINIAFEV
ncbi:hypothetical protein AX14_009612 [Amanita brunnescens Koide BX004]|nr:hypothetical protein AX14_009612 [Amanita brunnescens Koide BX004]